MPTQKLLERKALIVGIVINVLQVLAGMAVKPARWSSTRS